MAPGWLRPARCPLTDLDLAVEEGEIFGFLGPNGAGKTTTIKILLGLIRPTTGRGTLLGRRFGSREARREVGYVPDTPNFYRYLTGRELLEFTGRLHGINGGALPRQIEQTLDAVGLAEDARGRALRTYSRGMLQRIGIAAAVLHGPRLVVLDEPMNGLDPLGRREVRDLLLSLKREGRTVFLSSHVLADIESTADRVGILARGRLVRCGSLEEILSGGPRSIEISFEMPEDPVPQTLERRLDTLRRGARGWIGTTSDAASGQDVVHRILAEGGRLHGYHHCRTSLEDFFLRQIDPARATTRTQPEPVASPPVRSPEAPVASRTVGVVHETAHGEVER